MARPPSSFRFGKKPSDPTPPDVTPIINLFVTIIPMLLNMMIITQVTLIGINLASQSSLSGSSVSAGSGKDASKNKELRLVLYNNYFEIQVQDENNITIPMIKKGESVNYDYLALEKQLVSLKTRFPDIGTIKLVPYPDVKYGVLIHSIDICKEAKFTGIGYGRPSTKHFMIN